MKSRLGALISVPSMWVALAIALAVVCVLAAAAVTGVQAALAVVTEALASLVSFEYEHLAALLGPFRPAHGSELEGWVVGLLLIANLCGGVWGVYKVYAAIYDTSA